jgi:acetyltransferase-like isoleucine patch superfamily enzyme
MKIYSKITKFVQECKNSSTSPFCVIAHFLIYRAQGMRILAYQKVRIDGLKNLRIGKIIRIGTDYEHTASTQQNNLTSIRVEGELIFKGDFTIGKGCKIHVGKNAICILGDGGYITSNTSLLVLHHLKIGKGCIISWDCQFIDEDFHEIQYAGRKDKPNKIIIGDHVWIGCNVTILKGSVIPDGCIVSANSLVRQDFEEKNSLISGNPAKIVKRDVSWN